MSLTATLAVRDLTDPAEGPHAIQEIVTAVLNAVTTRWPSADLLVHRGDRIVDVADNYDRLGYSPSAAARDARYTRYVSDGRMLRSQTSALIPGALRLLGATPGPTLIACPGIVYRRDCIDRLHTGTPHQLDLWWVTPTPAPSGGAQPSSDQTRGGRTRDSQSQDGKAVELLELVETALAAALPGVLWRTNPASHPYTTGGLEIEAWTGAGWVEIGECGVAALHVIGPDRAGLALGLGLDRLLMVRKGVDDIRLLRSADPRVATQMLDLTPYRPVSAQPTARRDVSVALPAGVTAEEIGDRVRDLLGPDAVLVEEVSILSATAPDDLPPASRERLSLRPGEVNVLVRVILRDLHATLPRRRANALRDRIYEGLHNPAHREPPTRPRPAHRAA
ncbi:PheS-related mystery ligase SrmL [Paractinoplanes atraurantiacus]|uniref:Phenylalanyl-tRNA synthetase alpha chain n=1 Tax=Paractinoplanes atraurantiacus TaxID=1036182 RepID=A0A285FHP9_9ACTN|nr:hypothetical protein [Actinoplanes atraurantiacus]SNY10755.1 phenylalanyl-tRNA synthetase alpha chain [Actinoplanes atraurantiacus]